MAEMGRPSHYTDPGQLEAAIQEYFANDEGKKTITGLAYHLGFESRQSLYDYEQKGDFSYIIKRARLKVEIGYEEALSGQMCTGAIFALKNMGWRDNQRTELTGADGKDLNYNVTLNLGGQPNNNEPIPAAGDKPID